MNKPLTVLLIAFPLIVLVGCGDISSQEAPTSNNAAVDRPKADQPAREPTQIEQSNGHLGYVPVYSEIRTAIGTKLLGVNVSVRNIDLEQSLILNSVRYYDNEGKLLTEYLDSPRQVAPLATVTFVVAQLDKEGGLGANFLIDWESAEPIAEPIIEAIMVGVAGTQALAFTSDGRTIED